MTRFLKSLVSYVWIIYCWEIWYPNLDVI